jgi:hypothetical protein
LTLASQQDENLLLSVTAGNTRQGLCLKIKVLLYIFIVMLLKLKVVEVSWLECGRWI